MAGIEFVGPGAGVPPAEFEALRRAVGAPPPWFGEGPLTDHLFQATWFPAMYFSAQNHINPATMRPFSLHAYYADAPDVIAYCVADGDRHLATIGAPFLRRLVKVCDMMGEALAVRPRIGRPKQEGGKPARDPAFADLLAGDVDVSEAEAQTIVAQWPAAMKEGQQIELGPYAVFHDLVRLIWVHEWAHALTGHVRFVQRNLQLGGLPEFSRERAGLVTDAGDHPPAHEVFQAIELHADEFAVRYCAQQILWGYDPVGRLAGPRIDLIDRLLMFNTAFCIFAVMWWITERRYTPDESFYPQRLADNAPGPDPLFATFSTTHPPAALRYLRYRDFERDLAAAAGAQVGNQLGPLVDAVSFGFLSESLTDLDPHFNAFLAVTPMLAKTPTMDTLIAYETHLLGLNAYLEPHLVELGYRPTRDPAADD